ncbi:MAG: pseudouridine synthase [Bacteroidia bacterium]
MRYFLIYKPYNMLSQFSKETDTQTTLQDLGFAFPKEVYPVGRLDSDSEGLLLLTDDKSLNQRLLNPKFAHSRTYCVQVEGEIGEEALAKLRNGVKIRIDKKEHLTQKAQAEKCENEPNLPPREPPIRYRANIPTSWLLLTLTEGKNRQVRRMTAAVGFPTLRLVRVAIGGYEIGEMQPAEVRELSWEEVQVCLSN